MDDNSLRSQLRIVFEQIDKDKSGTLSLDEIEEGLKMVNLGSEVNVKEIAQEIFNETKTDGLEAVSYESFLAWNLRKITSKIARGQASALAEMFISPAFKVVNILKTVLPLLPHEKNLEVQWCIDQISGGEIYSPGKITKQSLDTTSLATDTLLIIGFFSNMNKVKQIENDVTSSAEIQRRRKTLNMSIFRRPSMPPLDADINDIDLNIWNLRSQVSNPHHVLHFISDKVFNHWDLYNKMSIDPKIFSKYTESVAEGYRDNPYHNNIHAADVMQFCHLVLHKGNLVEIAKLDTIHILSLVLAGMIHDLKHPGVTNSFIEANLDELALTYNDRSVLENFHVSEAFRISQKANCNIFEGLEKEEFRMIRHLMIRSVLGTDVQFHGVQLGWVQNKLQNQPLYNEKETVLEVFLHAADISHSIRQWEVHNRWSSLLQEEFFAQGDIEKQMGRTVISLFDREKASFPSLQLGFINGVILPYFTPLLKLTPEIESYIKSIEKNRDCWADLV